MKLLEELQQEKLQGGQRSAMQAHKETIYSLIERLVRKFTPQVREIDEEKLRRDELLGRITLTELRF